MKITKSLWFLFLVIVSFSPIHLVKAKATDAVIINIGKDKKVFLYYESTYLDDPSLNLLPGDTLKVDFNKAFSNPVMVYVPEGFKYPGMSFLIMPGDTVKLDYDAIKESILFKGKHQEELNFGKQLGQKIYSLKGPYNQIAYGFKMPFEEYLTEWDKIYLDSEQLIKTLKSFPSIRPEVVSYYEKAIRLRVFQILLIPVITQESNKPLRPLDKVYKDAVTSQAKKLKVFENSSEPISREPIYALRSYAMYLARNNGKHGEFMVQYDIIRNDYQGKLKEFALYSILQNLDAAKEDITPLLKDFEELYGKENKYALKLAEPGKLNNVNLLADVKLNDTLYTANNQAITFFDILKKNKGKVIYLDLWASWCKPCLEEMPASLDLADEYKNKDVVVLYLSIDEDHEKWQDSRTKFLADAPETYRFKNVEKAGLKEKFKIGAIPRFLIIDKEGVVRYAYAPNPHDSKLKPMLNTLLNKQ
jgi:thiol-disulfide isomerase/thioredoxin